MKISFLLLDEIKIKIKIKIKKVTVILTSWNAFDGSLFLAVVVALLNIESNFRKYDYCDQASNNKMLIIIQLIQDPSKNVIYWSDRSEQIAIGK